MQWTATAFIPIHYGLPVPSNTSVATLDVCFLWITGIVIGMGHVSAQIINENKKCNSQFDLEAQQTVQGYCKGLTLREGDHSDSHNLFLGRLAVFTKVNLVLTFHSDFTLTASHIFNKLLVCFTKSCFINNAFIIGKNKQEIKLYWSYES